MKRIGNFPAATIASDCNGNFAYDGKPVAFATNRFIIWNEASYTIIERKSVGTALGALLAERKDQLQFDLPFVLK